MRRILTLIFGLWLGGLVVAVRADTFPLADGTTVSGDIVSFNDFGIIFRQPDDKYSDRVAWTKFSQDGLKQLAKNPKIEPLVEPFIEIPASARPQKPEVKINEVKNHLDLPPKQSLLGALFSSSVGLFALFLIYAANVYAGFEIAVVKARSKGLVMGVAAVLPIIGPIIFLSLPMQVEAAPAEAQVESDPATFAVAGQTPVADEIHVVTGSGAAPAPSQAAGQIFQRGQFTFNRRFFETKFAGFFGTIRTGDAANSVLTVKATSGLYTVERITRIAASDVHLEVALGEVRQEIMVPFADIQEIRLKPKDS